MIIKTHCPFCKASHQMEISEQGFFNWKHKGMHIQNAFPEMSAENRERLISGTCPRCWDEMFFHAEA